MRALIIAVCSLIPFGAFSQASDSPNKHPTDTSKFQTTLDEVTIRGKRPMVQLLPDKTIVNVDASITNDGATLMEVLEKSPGITVDRNGNISLKGKQGVMIMIDGKPAVLSGNDLNNLLTGMSASQVDQIEIMDNPTARYDAAGNAGIINIKIKKNRQKGFNGNLNLSSSQGRFNKTFNTLTLNYYAGKLNLFATVGSNIMRNFTDMYAFRKYYDDAGDVVSMLEQPTYFKWRAPSQNVKVGADYFLTRKTTLGLVISGSNFARRSIGHNTALWKNAAEVNDSMIITRTNNREHVRSGTINLTARHVFSDKKELAADMNYLGYRTKYAQYFTNRLDEPDGYLEEINGNLPSTINVFSAKADYMQTFDNGVHFEAGWKSSHVSTNNDAAYTFRINGGIPEEDLGKTNHFLYDEQLHAGYITLKKSREKWTFQGGLRYELTRYDARQLGNRIVKDSSFSRKYGNLFPTGSISFQADSLNSFTFSAGRRIDRPGFHSLNPFVYVINKYTYETGNPFYKPQYTWNTELTHSFKDIVTTSLGYSYTKDYFSQIFYSDSSDIITYSEGNLEKMENLSLSVSSQASPFSWWSFSGEAVVNYKMIKGFVWDERRASLTQFNINISNRLMFSKGWSAELSGVYTLSEQELQEVTDPTGQVGAGVAKQLLKSKGTLKLGFRDIFYTQAMRGNTVFKNATEYFRFQRDTRVVTLTFNYRFGGPVKNNNKRPSGGADEEIRRIGNE